MLIQILFIDEQNSPGEPVAPSRPTKKQHRTVSIVAKATVSSTKQPSPAETPSKPLTRTFKKDKSSAANIGYESANALSLSFYCVKNRENWNVFSKRSIIGERVFNRRSGKSASIIQLLESVHMMVTVTKPKPFIAAIVYEFFANFSSPISVQGSSQYQKVCVRGHVYDFSAELINEYFGLLDYDDLNFWLNRLPSDDELDMDKVATKIKGRHMVWKAAKSYTLLTTHIKVYHVDTSWPV